MYIFISTNTGTFLKPKQFLSLLKSSIIDNYSHNVFVMAALPDLFFSLLNQIHQNLVEIVLVSALPSMPFLCSLHILLVCGTGNVASVVSQTDHRDLAHPALVSAVPGEGRRQWLFNRSFGHCSDLVWFGFLACRACNNARWLYFLLIQSRNKVRKGEYSTILSKLLVRILYLSQIRR